MQLEIVTTQGQFKPQKRVIVRNEKGEEVLNKSLQLTNPNSLRSMGVDDNQIAILDAARKAGYSNKVVSQSKHSNNQPLIQENLLPPKTFQRVVHFTPPRAANPEFSSHQPTPPTKKFPKIYVKDEEFPLKEEKEEDEFGFRAKLYMEEPTITSSKPFHLSPKTLFKTPPKVVAAASRGFHLLASNNDLPGYENVGFVSCFCNAVFRALVSLPVLERALLDKQELWEKHVQQDQVALNAGLVKAFQAYRNKTRFSPSRELLPRLPRFHKSYSQEDAHEFLLALLNACENELVCKSITVPTHQVFSSTMEKTLCCSACNKRRKTEDETFLVHSLGIPTTAHSLQDLLCESLRSEAIEFTCEHCNKSNVQFTLSSKFKTAPQVLVLHLKRHEKLGGLIHKNFTAVDIPLVLEIGQEFQCSDDGDDTTKVLRYELCSLVLHSGSTPRSGHYTAIGRRPDLKQSWLMFDDMRTTPISESSLALHSADAYLYFYSLT